jgi:hypothetical protein
MVDSWIAREGWSCIPWHHRKYMILLRFKHASCIAEDFARFKYRAILAGFFFVKAFLFPSFRKTFRWYCDLDQITAILGNYCLMKLGRDNRGKKKKHPHRLVIISFGLVARQAGP